MTDPLVLVTGATGYVGGRLVPLLLEEGYRVRAVSRSRSKLSSRSWANHTRVQIRELNALDLGAMRDACRGCQFAYYLIHSMNPQTQDFARADRRAAHNMTDAAEECNLERIIYLGGLGEEGEGLSKHLRSRVEVGNILRSGETDVTMLRAAIILGSGSASFEILRYLVERLPVMITPQWVHTDCQPIAIRNVMRYLVGCLKHPETAGEVFDIGGPEILTYAELMQIYAREAGLRRRWIVPVPVLTPYVSSLWVHLVTPVPSQLARPLIEGLRNPVVCRDNRIREYIPQDLMDCAQAIRTALSQTVQRQVQTRWTDAGILPPAEWTRKNDPSWAGGTVLEDEQTIHLRVSPGQVWDRIEKIGGDRGWYSANVLWKLRGWVDRLIGGVGLRRGRRDPDTLRPGDAVDFWRVIEVDAPRRLVLAAEMKLPGQAYLEFEVEPAGEECVRIRQRALFYPRGLAGLVYWYLLYPAHQFVFRGMLRGLTDDFPRVDSPAPRGSPDLRGR